MDFIVTSTGYCMSTPQKTERVKMIEIELASVTLNDRTYWSLAVMMSPHEFEIREQLAAYCMGWA